MSEHSDSPSLESILRGMAEQMSTISKQLGTFNDRLDNFDMRLSDLEHPDPRRESDEPKDSASSEESSRSKPKESITGNDFLYEDIYDKEESISGAPERNKKSSNSEPPKRRQSIIERRTELAQSISQKLNFTTVQPDYSKIHLAYLSVSTVSKFFEDLFNYQTCYTIKLHTPTLVSATVRDQLIAVDPVRLGNSKFFALDDLELFRLACAYIQPVSKVDFYTKLDRNVEFTLRSNYWPSPERFRPFYDALLLYKNDFLKVYEVLAFKGQDNLPDCKNKSKGLIKCFLDKIPYEYGHNVNTNFASAQFADIYEFIKRFYETVEEHKQTHQLALKMAQCFSGTAYEARKSLRVKPVSYLENDGDELNALAVDFFEDVYDNDEDEFEGDLAAMQEPSKDPMVCFNVLLYGSCSKEGCKYSHRSDLAAKKRELYIDLMRKQQQNQNHPHSKAAGFPPRKSNMHNIEN